MGIVRHQSVFSMRKQRMLRGRVANVEQEKELVHSFCRDQEVHRDLMCSENGKALNQWELLLRRGSPDPIPPPSNPH